MKVTKQINLDLAKKYGISGRNESELENQLQTIVRDTDDNIDRRSISSTYKFLGISVNIPDSAIKPVQKCCAQDDTRYRFLYKTQKEELLKALISHYLYDDKPLTKDDATDIIDRAIEECRKLGLEPERVSSNTSYLRTWLIYKLNQVLANYIS